MTAFTLADLERIVAERAASADVKSYTASLYAKGIGKASQKLGEEAVETVIAAVSGDRQGVVSESADLLYHLIVVLGISGIKLEEILEELDRRTAQTGIEEKAARGHD
ncbi:phosphoribosyl-ATP diphosphatase [Phyllobacterium sp. A18/5-2]|jgi:phosphoribosyl-ATP pyrophosphohydrolase|uniref:phosphoribosyl-ATP diphosphatase n=1 Tax=Phyllobacterium sp. A18/5-2 TaxID=2978392 RepID=UPI000DE01F1A|nr:phosphoribosyl-ATP diphosphatase [Phyllobacterium sp. A18/5-2]UXN65358.1 phosphoribosyl-ATP diphosphatase [Phyllobacterium sp. A18/5-2]